MAYALPPSAEAVVTAYLRSRPRIAAIVADRVYTVIPNEPTYPLLRVTRIGGAPLSSRPLHADRARLQLDAFGGPKATADELARTAQAELAELPDLGTAGAVVSSVELGPLAFDPDTRETPARNRYRFTAALVLHP